MAGISLAEINAVIEKTQIATSPINLKQANQVCMRQSDIIFCSNPNCKNNKKPLILVNRLELLKKGWKVIGDAWYCPTCSKYSEKNKEDIID